MTENLECTTSQVCVQSACDEVSDMQNSPSWFLDESNHEESLQVPKRPSWRTLAFVVAAGLLVCIGFALSRAVIPSHPTRGTMVSVTENASASPEPVEDDIVVDVHGDVRQPGVVRLPAGARLQDAVRAAGGYRHGADSSDVNAAEPLVDGMEVMIPEATSSIPAGGGEAVANELGSVSGSAPGTTSASGAGATTATGPHSIDVNTADLATLETLPGIGPSKASAIVQYRTAHGAFHNLMELRHVHGIGATTWNRIAPYLYVSAANGAPDP